MISPSLAIAKINAHLSDWTWLEFSVSIIVICLISGGVFFFWFADHRNKVTMLTIPNHDVIIRMLRHKTVHMHLRWNFMGHPIHKTQHDRHPLTIHSFTMKQENHPVIHSFSTSAIHLGKL